MAWQDEWADEHFPQCRAVRRPLRSGAATRYLGQEPTPVVAEPEKEPVALTKDEIQTMDREQEAEAKRQRAIRHEIRMEELRQMIGDDAWTYEVWMLNRGVVANGKLDRHNVHRFFEKDLKILGVYYQITQTCWMKQQKMLKIKIVNPAFKYAT